MAATGLDGNNASLTFVCCFCEHEPRRWEVTCWGTKPVSDGGCLAPLLLWARGPSAADPRLMREPRR
jgi:hypothetical protein